MIALDVANFLYVISNKGASEEIIKCLIKEVEQSGDVILYVKEAHHFFKPTTPQAREFAYILKHALERGVIQVLNCSFDLLLLFKYYSTICHMLNKITLCIVHLCYNSE